MVGPVNAACVYPEVLQAVTLCLLRAEVNLLPTIFFLFVNIVRAIQTLYIVKHHLVLSPSMREDCIAGNLLYINDIRCELQCPIFCSAEQPHSVLDVQSRLKALTLPHVCER